MSLYSMDVPKRRKINTSIIHQLVLKVSITNIILSSHFVRHLHVTMAYNLIDNKTISKIMTKLRFKPCSIKIYEHLLKSISGWQRQWSRNRWQTVRRSVVCAKRCDSMLQRRARGLLPCFHRARLDTTSHQDINTNTKIPRASINVLHVSLHNINQAMDAAIGDQTLSLHALQTKPLRVFDIEATSSMWTRYVCRRSFCCFVQKLRRRLTLTHSQASSIVQN